MTAVERLARRICWLGFSGLPREDTEATYWAVLPAETHKKYIEEARYYLWLRKKLSSDKNMSLVGRAAMEQERPK